MAPARNRPAAAARERRGGTPATGGQVRPALDRCSAGRGDPRQSGSVVGRRRFEAPVDAVDPEPAERRELGARHHE